MHKLGLPVAVAAAVTGPAVEKMTVASGPSSSVEYSLNNQSEEFVDHQNKK